MYNIAVNLQEPLSFVLKHGNDLEKGIVGVYFHELLDAYHETICTDSKLRYLNWLDMIMSDSGVPFSLLPSNPPSVFYTAQALSNLLDLQEEYHSLSEQLVNLLIQRQDPAGWWKDCDELKTIENLPVWQHPDNASVKILNTAVTAAVLSQIQVYNVEKALDRSIAYLESKRSENGSFLGFPQSTWVITPLIARKYGFSSARFLLHWSVLNNFVDRKQPLENLIIIGRGLVNANIEPEDTLLSKISGLIEELFSERGWKDETGKYSTSLTVAAMIVLDYCNPL